MKGQERGQVRLAWQRVLAVWHEYILFFPVFGITCCLLLTEGERGLWLFVWYPLSALIGAAWGVIVRWRRENLWILLLSVGAMALAAAGILQEYFTWQQGAAGMLAYMLLARGIQAGSRSYAMLEKQWQFAGIALTLISYAAAHYVESLFVLQGYLSITGMISLLTLLFYLNHHQLVRANRALHGGNGQLPRSIASFNRRYLAYLVLGIVVMVLIFFSSFMDEVSSLLHRFIAMLLRPGEMVEAPPPPPPGPSASDFLSGLGEAKEPSAFAKLLERLMIGAGWLIIAALTIWVLGIVLKKLIKTWMPGLWKRLMLLWAKKDRAEASRGYVDEETDLFQWEQLRHRLTNPIMKAAVKLRRRTPRLEDYATNKERIRFLYRDQVRRAVKAGYEPHRYLTPSETLQGIAEQQPSASPDSLKALSHAYNEARYGDQEISDAQVKHLAEALESNHSYKPSKD